MLKVVESLVPIVLLVVTGAGLLRFGFYDQAFRRGLDRLVYWVALPALIVAKLAEAPAIGERAGPMVLVLGGATVGAMLLSYPVAWALRLPRAGVGVFAQASFRANLAYVGLPVVVLATGHDREVGSLAVLVFAPIVVLYNVLSVGVLTLAQERLDWGAPRRLGWSLVTNPMLIACGLGVAMVVTRVRPPGPVLEGLDMIGRTAAPLALIGLGGAVVTYQVHQHAVVAGAAAAIKLVALPAMVLAGAWALELDATQRLIVLVFSAAPTAAASYVLAVQLRGDPGVAAATIVVSTVLSALALAAALGLA